MSIEVVMGSQLDIEALAGSWSREQTIDSKKDFSELIKNEGVFSISPSNSQCVPDFPCPQKGQCWCPGGQ